jgi:predicted neutral ceramidase superfamily lipid hydrolase
MILISLLHLIQVEPPSSPPTPFTQTKEFWEKLLEPPTLIPVIIGVLAAIFLFIFIFKYCNKERASSLVKVINVFSSFIKKKKKVPAIISSEFEDIKKKIPEIVFK